MPKITLKNKWRRSLGLLAAVMVLIVPLATQAGIIDGIVGLALDPIYDIILSLINMVVNFIGTVLIGLAASIVNYTFNFPNFVTSPVVQIGWSVSRDLANMAFILIMLSIAFAYILDLDIYGVKKMIVPLIIMALLLNFSLIIGGVFIDIGNSLGKFFVSGGAGNSTGVGDGIMAAVKAGQLAQIRNNVAVTSPVSNLIMASVFQLVFYIILAFMLFAMGFVMLYRIVNLWVLLILAPLAWVCIAIPNMKSYYSQWWSKFLKWAFYPVGLGFFVYIGTLAGASLFGTDLSSSNFVRDTGGLAWLLPDTQISLILQFIVVMMILMMGLAVSESWAGKSGKMVMDWGKSAKDWGRGKIKGKATMVGGRLAQKALYKTDEKGQPAGARSLVSGLSKMPLVGQALRLPTSLIDQRKKVVDAEGEKLKSMSTQTVRLLFPRLSKEGQVSALKKFAESKDIELTSRKDIAKKLGKEEDAVTTEELTANGVGQISPKNGGMDQKTFESTLKYASSLGLDKEILNAAPQFAEIVGKKLQEVIEKISPANAGKIQSGSLELPQVQEAIKNAVINAKWDAGQLGNVGKESPVTLAVLLKYLETQLTPAEKSKLSKRTKTYIYGTPSRAMEDEEGETEEQTTSTTQGTQPAPAT